MRALFIVSVGLGAVGCSESTGLLDGGGNLDSAAAKDLGIPGFDTGDYVRDVGGSDALDAGLGPCRVPPGLYPIWAPRSRWGDIAIGTSPMPVLLGAERAFGLCDLRAVSEAPFPGACPLSDALAIQVVGIDPAGGGLDAPTLTSVRMGDGVPDGEEFEVELVVDGCDNGWRLPVVAHDPTLNPLPGYYTERIDRGCRLDDEAGGPIIKELQLGRRRFSAMYQEGRGEHVFASGEYEVDLELESVALSWTVEGRRDTLLEANVPLVFEDGLLELPVWLFGDGFGPRRCGHALERTRAY